MSLIANGNGTTEEQNVAGNGFWPVLSIADFRDQYRLDSSATNGRLAVELKAAVSDVTRHLRTFQQQAEDNGAQESKDVPLAPWQPDGELETLYRRAVFASAYAGLLEHYLDYSATGEGDDVGSAKADAADIHRRNARWAVAQIIGEPHSTVELI